MATQTIEFPASTGRTLIGELTALGSDVIIASGNATEAVNRKGIYTVPFTNIGGGDYRLTAVDGQYVPAYDGYVTLTLATSTFQAYDNYLSAINLRQIDGVATSGTIIDGQSLTHAIQLIAAAVAGSGSGGPTMSTWYGLDGQTLRISGYADSNGNRSAIVYF